ncbi:MAG: FecR domain-containing protein [Sandaracinaceae bacterium]
MTEDRERRDATADALAALARETETPPIETEALAAMIDRAVGEARARTSDDGIAADRYVSPWRSFGLGLLAAAVLFALGLAAVRSIPSRSAAAEEPAPTRLRLPTGDTLAVTPGARFDLERIGAERRVRLDDGEIAFDVRPLGVGESFAVVTPHLSVHVVGTVFTVAVEDTQTVVRVYEGHVRVTRDDASIELGAGELYRSAGPAEPEGDPLASTARAAAAARHVASSAPEVGAAAALAAHRADEAPVDDGVEEEDGPIGADVGAHVGEVGAVGGVDEDAHMREDAEEDVRESDGLGSARMPGARSTTRAVPVAPRASSERPTEAAAPTLAEVRAWIAAGEAARALDATRRAIDAGENEGAWRMLEGDALRALARPSEAVDAYERAATFPAQRYGAGYLVATLRADALMDPAGALASLDAHGCASPASPLAERALVLRVRLLRSLSRDADARDAIRAYLDRYPSGPHAEPLRAELSSGQ